MSDHARQGANGSPSRAASGAGRSSGAPSAGGPPGRDRPPRSRLIPIVGLGLAAGALLAGLVSLAVGEGGPTGIDVEGGNEAQRLFGGLPQEGAALGDPDAPVTLSIFNDLQCIECAEYQLAVVPPLVEDLVRPGEAKLELRHFPVGPKQTEVAGFAATAAGEQGSQWQYAHIFFANVDRVERAGVTDEVLDAVAAAVPADQFEIERWRLDRDPRSCTYDQLEEPVTYDLAEILGSGRA